MMTVLTLDRQIVPADQQQHRRRPFRMCTRTVVAGGCVWQFARVGRDTCGAAWRLSYPSTWVAQSSKQTQHDTRRGRKSIVYCSICLSSAETLNVASVFSLT